MRWLVLVLLLTACASAPPHGAKLAAMLVEGLQSEERGALDTSTRIVMLMKLRSLADQAPWVPWYVAYFQRQLVDELRSGRAFRLAGGEDVTRIPITLAPGDTAEKMIARTIWAAEQADIYGGLEGYRPPVPVELKAPPSLQRDYQAEGINP
jgi:hypothetical protein